MEEMELFGCDMAKKSKSFIADIDTSMELFGCDMAKKSNSLFGAFDEVELFGCDMSKKSNSSIL